MNPYKIELYRIDVGGSFFEKIDEIEGYATLEFTRRLNYYGSAIINIDVRHKKATKQNMRRWVNHIAIKKGSDIVWAGPITKLSPSIGVGVAGNLQIESNEHAYHLSFREAPQLLRFDNVDGSDIAWALIDLVQDRTNGELMIRQGNLATTVNRDRAFEYTRVFDAIFSLSNVRGGFDFDFTYQKDSNDSLEQINFNTYARKGVIKDNLPVLRLGQTVNKVDAVTVGDMANTINYLGAGTGDEIPISTLEDAGFQAAYTRREQTLKDPDISIQSTLDQLVDEYLEYNKAERYDVQVKLESLPSIGFGTFDVGDYLNLDLSLLGNAGEPSLIDFTGRARVTEINVEIDENGGEIVTPVISGIYNI
jgi:hypothetical protein